MTHYVGIDVAKQKHDIALIDDNGKLLESFQISNNQEGFYRLFSFLGEHNSDLKIALEATGHYSHNITKFLRDKHYQVWTYNPLLINEFAKSQSLRKTKTDKKDAQTIAQKLRLDNPNEAIAWDDFAFELRTLTRHRERLTKSRSNYKVQLVKVLDLTFPELAKVIGKANLNSQAIYELLDKYPSAKAVARAHDKSLLNIPYLKTDKAFAIKQAAKISIGTTSVALSFELKQIISELKHTSHLITECDKEIKAIMSEFNSPILSIPGIGDVTGAAIIGEISSIDNFQNHNQLLAFAGLEPSIYQSGQATNNGRMVKRGSSHLRRAVILSSRIISMHSPTMKAYLKKKLGEGKHFNVAITHVAKKLIRVIFSVLKNDKPYQEPNC